jgi:gamma-glutamyl-gamma-aminobutyrate hydrolase PuuD
VGLVMTGGNNISSCEGDRLSKQRDNFEKRLMLAAIEEGIPILAVCRGSYPQVIHLVSLGMQLVADFFGLNLKKKPGHVATKHRIKVREDSKFAGLLTKYTTTNSYHVRC